MVVGLDLHQLVELNLLEAVDVFLLRQEHLGLVALDHGGVVLVGDERALAVLLVGVLDHPEERVRHLLAVDDELRAEDLVAAVLGVHLAEHHELGVGGIAPRGLEAVREILHLRLADRKAELDVRLANGVHALLQHVERAAGLRRRTVEEIVERVVDALGHLVVEGRKGLAGNRRGNGEADAALDAGDALQTTVAEDVRRLRAPRGDRALAGGHVERTIGEGGLGTHGVQKRTGLGKRLGVRALTLGLDGIHPRRLDFGVRKRGNEGAHGGAESVKTELRIRGSSRKQNRFHLCVAFVLKLMRKL